MLLIKTYVNEFLCDSGPVLGVGPVSVLEADGLERTLPMSVHDAPRQELFTEEVLKGHLKHARTQTLHQASCNQRISLFIFC